MKSWIIWCLKLLSEHGNTHLSSHFWGSWSRRILSSRRPWASSKTLSPNTNLTLSCFGNHCGLSFLCVQGAPVLPLPTLASPEHQELLRSPDIAQSLFLMCRLYNDLNLFFLNAISLKNYFKCDIMAFKNIFCIAFVCSRLVSRPGVFGI